MNEPLVLHDRTAVSTLLSEYQDLITAFTDWRIGKVDEKDTVHFCGMVVLKTGSVFVFAPRGLFGESSGIAKKTMRVLLRYGQERASREFCADGSAGNTGMLSVIKRLIDDFCLNGIYIERERLRSRENGKPDWLRTLIRGQPLFSNENILHTNIFTSKLGSSRDSLLAQIQVAVLKEINENHGWWNDSLKSRSSDLRFQKSPTYPRRLWSKLLGDLLPTLYSERAIFLAKYLIFYIDNSRLSTSGNYVFGVEDFHSIWEEMLKATLIGVQDDLNSKLPKPVYRYESGAAAESNNRGMQTDIILKSDEYFTIVDAKYYAAKSSGTAPGWSDIVKQMFYEVALRDLVGAHAGISNMFLFPSTIGKKGNLFSVGLERSNSVLVPGIPIVDCRYASIEMVMNSYIEKNRNLNLSDIIV